MVWWKLKVGIWDIKFSPIKPLEVKYPYCDKDGNELKRITNYNKGYYLNEATGERHDFAYNLINGKPYSKFKEKTKVVNDYTEVDVKEIDNLLVDNYYLVDSDVLLKELKDSGKALKFKYHHSNTLKVYWAYVKPSKTYPNFLEMFLSRTKKHQVIMEIIEKLDEKKKKSTEAIVQKLEVEQPSENDLLMEMT